MTLPVALYGFFLFPDTPATTRAFYLSENERALAQDRVPEVHDRSPMTWSFVRKVLTSWYWWGFVVLWIIAGETESFSSNSLLALYMKSHPTNKYTVAQLNNYPTGVPAVGIVSTLFWATLTDFLSGKRYLVGYFIGVTGIVTSAMILQVEKDPTSSRSTAVVFGAYYWAGAVYACQATFFAWCNDAMRFEEPVFRGVVLAGMNLGSNSVNAWWSIILYGASMAPWFNVSTPTAVLLWNKCLILRFHPAWYVGNDCGIYRPCVLVRWIIVVPPSGRYEEERRRYWARCRQQAGRGSHRSKVRGVRWLSNASRES